MNDPSRLFREAQDAFASGIFDAAFTAATFLIDAVPDHAQARALRANTALKLDRLQDAIADLAWLLDRQPDHATIRRNLSMCWMRLGNRNKDAGEFAAADGAYRNALGIDPANDAAHYNLGLLLLESAKSTDAQKHLEFAAAADPGNINVVLKLAEAQIESGNNGDAVKNLERIAVLDCTREQMQQCSRLLLRAASPDIAKSLALKLIQVQPKATGWGREFCHQLRKNSDLAGSRELLGFLRNHTDNPTERLRVDTPLALGLPSTYSSLAELHTVRSEYLTRLDALVEAYPISRIARIQPNPEALLWDNFFLAYQGEDDVEPQRRFGRWIADSLQCVMPEFAAPLQRVRHARPRLAMVSSRFHKCTVGSYFTSWVEHLGQSGWDLILVHIGDTRDALTARLANAAQHEVALSGNLASAARTLHDLDADIILYPELGMDFRALGLAALRLAPAQVCAWGHPVTTGLPTIDAYVSCAEMEPVGAAAHYTERLLMLPDLGTRYLSHRIPESASRGHIGLPEDSTLYLVPQSLFKIHPDNDSVIVDIARRDPSAVFVFFENKESGSRAVFEERLRRAFAAAGINTAQRWLFLPARPRDGYLQVNMACDVMVDTLHFSGGNTSLDALHAGLPIVTCPGRFMRGRQSMAMLKHLGCDELIADTPQHLAELAVAVANDHPRRQSLGQRISSALPGLVQSDAPLHALDAHLKSLLSRH